MDSNKRRGPVRLRESYGGQARRRLGEGGFTLVEVVIAIGVFAVTILAVLGLLSPVSHSVSGVTDYDKAAALGDGIQTELVRLRDLTTTGIKLDALATLIPTSGGATALQIVAASDGSRVVRLSADANNKIDADNDPVTGTPPGIPPADRYFLIEIRQQPTFTYVSGTGADRSGFLAVTAVVKWPYTLGNGTPADLTQASSLLLNFAVPP